jgi:hypothetical protein
MLYERPRFYAISHILIGLIAVWFPIVGGIGVLYQLAQYAFNVRTFPRELRIEKGNSWQHTSLKLFEMAIGFAIGSLLSILYNN